MGENPVDKSKFLKNEKQIDLLSGKFLTKKIFKFIKKQKEMGQLNKLKTTTEEGKICKIHAIRCKALQALIDYITGIGKIGNLTNQHNIIKTFLGSYWLDIPLRNFEINLKDLNRKINLIKGNTAYEVKTTTNLSYNDISILVTKYYSKIIGDKEFRDIWWLVFVIQVDQSKVKKGRICIYYMIVIELKSEDLKMGSEHQKMVIEDVQGTLDKTIKKIKEEDNFDEEAAIFLPVKNHLIVDNLRNKLAASKKKNIENDKRNAETDNKLNETKKKLAEKDKRNAETEKKLAETKKKLAEKEKIINNLLKNKK